MASHPQKKSFIPRIFHDCDKQEPSLSKVNNKANKGTAKPSLPVKTYSSGHPIRSLPLHDDGLIPEDDDAVRRSLLALETDRARMKQSLEETVREAEERIQDMQKLLEEREKLLADNGKLSQQVEDQEKKLIENNIDPETGLPLDVTTDQKAAAEKQKKISKADVSQMRERLQLLNENSDMYLIDIQKILREIEEVEATSLRVGGLKPEDALSPEEMAEVIKEMEEAQKKADKDKTKEKGEVEEESEEEESSTAEEAEKITVPSKDELFVTQNQD